MTPDLTLGPITIDVIELAVRGSTSPTPTVTAEALVGVTGSLPPISFTVNPFGIALQIDFVNGNAGPADIATVFVPPTGLGLSVEAPLTSGGGRIAAYPETGRYEGALAIDIASVGIQAMTVIDTAVAGEPDGWTFFASLTARFPGIPLGFGFTLTGAGGLVALNRAVDGEALALGLRDGAADALLFPDDPVRDSAILFGQLDEYFPACPGNTVIGPVIEVGWGTPTIVTGQLGVLISLPQGVLTILGSLGADLPTPDAPVLELRMDSLGVIDVPGGTVLVVASLYDSRLLGVIELSGDAGLYLSVIEDPYFVLSVGGYHPGFQPPSHVPAVLESLRQMRAEVEVADGVSAAITAYFAVTSNSVQFGGGFELEASAEFLSVTYLARGWFEFDVLLQFTPFLLIADVSAGVGVYAGDKELLGVELFAAPGGARAVVRHRQRPLPLLRGQRQVRRHCRRPRRPRAARHGRRPRSHGRRARPPGGLVGAAPERAAGRPRAAPGPRRRRHPARRQRRRRAVGGAAGRDPGPLRRADPRAGRGRRRRHRRGRRRHRGGPVGRRGRGRPGLVRPGPVPVDARRGPPGGAELRAAPRRGGVRRRRRGRPRATRPWPLPRATRPRSGSPPPGRFTSSVSWRSIAPSTSSSACRRPGGP